MTLTEREKKRKSIIGAMISTTEPENPSESVVSEKTPIKQNEVVTTSSVESESVQHVVEAELQQDMKQEHVENIPSAKITPKTLDNFVKDSIQGFQKENILVESTEQPTDVSTDMVNSLVEQLLAQKENGGLDAATLRELTQQTIQGYTSKSALKIACCVPQMVSVCNACEYRKLCPKCLSDTEKVRTTIYIPKELNLACNLMFKMDKRFKNLNKSVVITEFLRSLCGDYYIQMAHESLEKYRK